MQFIAFLQAHSKTAILARSQKRPFVDVAGIRFHWNGRTYAARRLIEEPLALAASEPEVVIAAVIGPSGAGGDETTPQPPAAKPQESTRPARAKPVKKP